MKHTIWTLVLLALLCVTLLLLPGCGDAPGSSDPDAPGGSAPNGAASTGDGVFADPTEADAAFQALLQEALAAGEPKQLWAADFCTEQRREAATWRCELLDCRELREELLERLLPAAVVRKQSSEPGSDTVRYELRMGSQKLACNCDQTHITIRNLTSEQVRELLPQAEEWLEEKCGLELREWAGHTDALSVYTFCVDGLPIVPKQMANSYNPWYCGLWGDRDSIAIQFPFTLGEQAGTVSLYEHFSPEELRMTLEFGFDPSKQIVEAYRSCELCYLPDGQRELLVPVWWVRGTSCNLETGAKTPFELWLDAETGQLYDRMD